MAWRRFVGRSGLWPCALAAALSLAAPTLASALEAVGSFGANPGELLLRVYRPDGLAAGAPLVVAMHGCRQTAEAFDDETGLTRLADELQMLLIFPEQQNSNNDRNCFNWFDEDDNRAGRGESASIRSMIDWAVAEYDADPSRVYALGLSAGGAMTSVLLANYPERFAGGAVIAGTPFDCNQPSGFSSSLWLWWNLFAGEAGSAVYACGLFGSHTTDKSPEEWGDAVREAAGATPQHWPLVSLWQGSADDTVDPENLDELIDQWTDVHGIARTPVSVETVAGAQREVFAGPDGFARVEAWRIPGFPHAMPVDPDATQQPCGQASEFIVDANLCAVRRIAKFWGLSLGP